MINHQTILYVCLLQRVKCQCLPKNKLIWVRFSLSFKVSWWPWSLAHVFRHSASQSDISWNCTLSPSLNWDSWCYCHGSIRDACPQGWPGVAGPSEARTKNIGRKESQRSWRKNMDWSDGSGREYWRIGRTHQIMRRLEISVLIVGLDMIGW